MAKICRRRKEETVVLDDAMEMYVFMIHDDNGASGFEKDQEAAEAFAQICADQVSRPFYVTSCVATLTEHKPLVKVEPRIFEDEPSESYEEWSSTDREDVVASERASSVDDDDVIPF